MTDPATPVPSATILMLRDSPDGLETFMVVRHHQIDFASGALVFPGGKLDDGDFVVREYCDGVNGVDDTTVGLMVGAIREAFEECGIFLAREKGASDLISGERLTALEPYRNKLHQGELSLEAFLDQEQLTLACDKLQHFAHWITPPVLPKRFDTHFYLAVAPADHLAVHDGHESVDSVWISPADAARGANDGTYTIIFPTLANVEMLGESNSVESALEMARSRNIVSILPWTEEREDGTYVCIPADAGYALFEQKFPEKV